MEIFERKVVHDYRSSICHEYYPKLMLPLHKHMEFEIIIFTAGNGKQFVGDGVEEFKAGDMTLIGSNVPHLHLCDAVLQGEDVNFSFGEGLVFPISIFPEKMDTLPDYTKINELLQRSQYGIRFCDASLSDEIHNDMQKIDNLWGIERLVLLLQILNKLANAEKYKTLSSTAYNMDNSIETVNEPVNKVFSYLFNNFHRKISLNDLAEYVGQNPTALCKYFKRHTGKSIFNCLMEIRIGHACKLLSYSTLTVSQVAYESGYNSTNLFNRQFYEITGRTPSEYRKQITYKPNQLQANKK